MEHTFKRPKVRGYAQGGEVEDESLGTRAARVLRNTILPPVADAVGATVNAAGEAAQILDTPGRVLRKQGSDFAGELFKGVIPEAAAAPKITPPTTAREPRAPVNIPLGGELPQGTVNVPQYAKVEAPDPTGLEMADLPARGPATNAANVEREAFNRGQQVAYGGQGTYTGDERQIVQGFKIPALQGDQVTPAAPAPAAPLTAATGQAPKQPEKSLAAQLLPHLITTESTGNQAAVSPKGALGVAQIMPKTAPEAARLAGLPWDEARYKSDPKYNAALGHAYLDKQIQDFGNPAMALAAYNAGPNALRKAIAKGGENWLAELPKETQAYVPKVLAAWQAAQPAAAPAAPAAPNLQRPAATSAAPAAPAGDNIEVIRGMQRTNFDPATRTETVNAPRGTPPELETLANMSASGIRVPAGVAERFVAERGATDREKNKTVPEVALLRELQKDPKLMETYRELNDAKRDKYLPIYSTNELGQKEFDGAIDTRSGEKVGGAPKKPPPGKKKGEQKEDSAGNRVEWDGKDWKPVGKGFAEGGFVTNRPQAQRDTATGTFDDQDRVTAQPAAAPAPNTQPNTQPFSRPPSTPTQQGQLESLLKKRGDAAKYGYANGGQVVTGGDIDPSYTYDHRTRTMVNEGGEDPQLERMAASQRTGGVPTGAEDDDGDFAGKRADQMKGSKIQRPKKYADGGMVEAGNINVSERPAIDNGDGTRSTVRSMSFNDGNHEVLIPTVVGGKIVGDDEAIAHHRTTGEHLGKFDTPENATAFAERLHQSEEKRTGYALGGLVSDQEALQGVDLFDQAAGNAQAQMQRNAQVIGAGKVNTAADVALSRAPAISGPFQRAKLEGKVVRKGIAAGVDPGLLPGQPMTFAQGGKIQRPPKGGQAAAMEKPAKPVAGKMLKGPGTAKSDSIPAVVDGEQPAALSTGEFVIPADVVAKLGPEFFEKIIAQAHKGTP